MRDRYRIDGGRLWAAGVATAVIAALIATVGILVARGLLHVAIFSPRTDGVWGAAPRGHDARGYETREW